MRIREFCSNALRSCDGVCAIVRTVCCMYFSVTVWILRFLLLGYRALLALMVHQVLKVQLELKANLENTVLVDPRAIKEKRYYKFTVS